MADLLIRGVPDELYQRYKQLAGKERRSVSAETIHLIEQAVTAEEQREQRAAALGRIAERRRRLPLTSPYAPDSLTMLREDRER